MVTVNDYAIRSTKDGKTFVALILQGGLSLVQSQKSGNFYSTVKQCSIPSTFDENTAKSFVGERMPGSVQRKECDPYEFVNKETGEIIQMNHRWVYVPEGSTIEDAIYEPERDPEIVLAGKPSLQPVFALGVSR